MRSEALKYIIQILPVLLRFLADEYDDTCSTVFPFLQTVLTGVSSSSYSYSLRSSLAIVQESAENLEWSNRRRKTIVLSLSLTSPIGENEVGYRRLS